MKDEIFSLNDLHLTLFQRGGKKSHPVSFQYCKAVAEGKADIASALNAWVVSLFQAAAAGCAATTPQAPGLLPEGLTGIFTCFRPYLFSSLRRN